MNDGQVNGGLSVQQVLDLHENLLGLDGGLPGVRDPGLLESALAQVGAGMFGVLRYVTPTAQATAYLYFIIKNHAFNDGNKRTATACMLLWLALHDLVLTATDEQLVRLAVRVAEGGLTQEDIAVTLETWTQP